MSEITIGGLTAYEIVWYFMIYSFLGWVLEVIYQAVSKGIVVNRGFLNGPVCPIYGFGMIAIIILLNTIFSEGAENVHGAVLFAFGLVLATLVELVGGWALDKLFHARWWDYSDRPFNLNGYICLQFSIYWGLGTVIAVRMLHPFVAEHTVDVWPENYGWPAAAAFAAVYLADTVVTIMIVNGLNKRLDELDDIRAKMRIVSDDLSDALGNGSIRTKQHMEERKAALQDKEKALYEKLLQSRVFGARRLLDAFPDMKMPGREDLLKDLKARLRVAK